MTALHATIDRKGDEVTVSGVYINRFKKPVNLKIVISVPVAGAPIAKETILRGDVGDVNGILYGLAETAWGMGWRPRALDMTLAMVVKTFKIPPVA